MAKYEVKKWKTSVLHETQIIWMICLFNVHALRSFEIKTIVICNRNLKYMGQSPVFKYYYHSLSIGYLTCEFYLICIWIIKKKFIDKKERNINSNNFYFLV